MHWPRLWCWEGLGAGGEGDDRGWDGWMAPLTRWTWVWVNSGRWWWTGRPGVLRFMGSQRVRHDWATELNWRNTVIPWKSSFLSNKHLQGKVKYIKLRVFIFSLNITPCAKKLKILKEILWFSLWSCMDVRVGLWRRLSAEELMLFNCGVGEDFWEFLGLQGGPTSPS